MNQTDELTLADAEEAVLLAYERGRRSVLAVLNKAAELNGALPAVVKHLDPDREDRISKAWQESQHPRDKNGRFIDGNTINALSHSAEGIARLHANVKPGDEGKLDAAISAARGEKQHGHPNVRIPNQSSSAPMTYKAEKMAGTVEFAQSLAAAVKSGSMPGDIPGMAKDLATAFSKLDAGDFDSLKAHLGMPRQASPGFVAGKMLNTAEPAGAPPARDERHNPDLDAAMGMTSRPRWTSPEEEAQADPFGMKTVAQRRAEGEKDSFWDKPSPAASEPVTQAPAKAPEQAEQAAPAKAAPRFGPWSADDLLEAVKPLRREMDEAAGDPEAFIRAAHEYGQWLKQFSPEELDGLRQALGLERPAGHEAVAASKLAMTALREAGSRVTGFKTGKGSEYVHHEDGTTTRNKAARDTPGHEGDFGQKERSHKTVYVNGNIVSALSSAGMHGVGEKGSRLAIKDGKATLLTWNEKAGKWGAAPSGRDIPVSDKPEVGLHPLELWNKTEDVPGHESYRKQHAGSPITDVTKSTPAGFTGVQRHEDGGETHVHEGAVVAHVPPGEEKPPPTEPMAPEKADTKLDATLSGTPKQGRSAVEEIASHFAKPNEAMRDRARVKERLANRLTDPGQLEELSNRIFGKNVAEHLPKIDQREHLLSKLAEHAGRAADAKHGKAVTTPSPREHAESLKAGHDRQSRWLKEAERGEGPAGPTRFANNSIYRKNYHEGRGWFASEMAKHLEKHPELKEEYGKYTANEDASPEPAPATGTINHLSHGSGNETPEPSIAGEPSAEGSRGVYNLSLPRTGNEIREHKIGDTKVVLDANGNTGEMTVSSVRTPANKRGKGSARQAMTQLVEQADKEGVPLKLGASPLDRKTTTAGLVKFYESLGFSKTGKKINPAGDPEMMRRPNSPASATGTINPPTEPAGVAQPHLDGSSTVAPGGQHSESEGLGSTDAPAKVPDEPPAVSVPEKTPEPPPAPPAAPPPAPSAHHPAVAKIVDQRARYGGPALSDRALARLNHMAAYGITLTSADVHYVEHGPTAEQQAAIDHRPARQINETPFAPHVLSHLDTQAALKGVEDPVEVSGLTSPHKEAIRAVGGRYDRKRRVWYVPRSKADKVPAVLNLRRVRPAENKTPNETPNKTEKDMASTAAHDLTADERKTETDRIRSEHAGVLATPLMSEGSISPAQLGMMSKRQLQQWQENGQNKMALEARIRDLGKTDEQLAAEKKELAEKASTAETDRRRHRYELLHGFAERDFAGVSGKRKLRAEYETLKQEFGTKAGKISKSLAEPARDEPLVAL